ncbi:hypothetical protein V6N11_067848 [Hibiscus sabdariffa]|uniref:Uncharacterized protein n=1 Tax=Hibiscus sabdariffa TaxID=183260 RepID=A0ABR2SRY8_9ROSI
MKMKMDGSFYVDPIGMVGGLALWWSNVVSILIHNSGKISLILRYRLLEKMISSLRSFMGPFILMKKQVFWESLTSLRYNSSKKWCLIGNSNMVTRPEEKLGGVPFDVSSAKWFYDFMDASCLLELLLKGGTFTWSNHRSEDEAIMEKLNHIIISLEWSSSFPKAIGVIDATIASDHALIFLLLKGMSNSSKHLGFRRKLNKTELKLRQCSKVKRGNNKLKDEEMKGRIKFLQGKQLSKNEMEELKTLKKDPDKPWESEELY